MKRRWAVTCGIIAGFITTAPAHAWDAIGHQVVARIAWDKMQPKTRQTAIALLKAAPEDAGLRSLLSDDARPLVDREREFFEQASTWADIVRDTRFSERRAKYHHSPWHLHQLLLGEVGP